MMNYPANYALICEEEMVYLEGGVSLSDIGKGIDGVIEKIYTIDQNLNKTKTKKVFDWVFGNYLRDSVFMSYLRADLWKSMQKGNFDAFEDRGDAFEDYSFIGQAAYIYGAFRSAEYILSILAA